MMIVVIEEDYLRISDNMLGLTFFILSDVLLFANNGIFAISLSRMFVILGIWRQEHFVK